MIELTQSQVKRVMEAKKGETIMLMFPIELSEYQTNMGNILEDIENIYIRDGILHIYIKGDYRQLNTLPVKKGDKDIVIKSEIDCMGDCNYGMPCIYCGSSGQGIGRAIAEVGKFSECIEVSVVRIFDLKLKEIEQITLEPIYANLLHYELMFKDYYNNQLKEQNINRTYEDNDYVFLPAVRK